MLIIIGSSLIFLTFVVFVIGNLYIANTYEGNEVLIYQGGIGIANGIIIFVFTEVYKMACIKAVELENHKFESHYEYSYIFKRCFFDFTLSYINLGYYAFYLQDFTLLSRNFITIIVTKNLLFALKVILKDQFTGIFDILVAKKGLLQKMAPSSKPEKNPIRSFIRLKRKDSRTRSLTGLLSNSKLNSSNSKSLFTKRSSLNSQY